MNTADKIRVILYRCHEKGLEVMLITPELHKDNKVWKLPFGNQEGLSIGEYISLEGKNEAGGVKAIAIEADWHELHSIPSVRGIVKHDIKRLGNKVKKVSLDGLDYHSVKDAIKRVLPNEYALLKELRDILVDRNQASLI